MKKVTFYIDDQPCQAEDGKNFVDAAAENGISIPSLCYYPHIDPPLATCRVCTVAIGGQPRAACSLKVSEGLRVQVNTPDLIENRKAILELIFAEGNHFCPACEKSGDCDLQHLAYESGITYSRFPHTFVDRIVDFKPERLVIDHNRCILCKRCVEEFVTDSGKKVFSYHRRGGRTEVNVDYELEAEMSDKELTRAMRLCPVGAILLRGKSESRPFGDRKYDKPERQEAIPLTTPVEKPVVPAKKKVVATASLAGCFGCHMSMLDIDLGLLDLIELVSFDKSPLTDIKRFSRHVDIGLIEGGCCNSENIENLEYFREHCDILVSVGECAIWGGLPAMRNTISLEACLEEAYLHSPVTRNAQHIIPNHEDIPKILDRVYPCHEVVKIDYHIPGCPPSAQHIWKVVQNILFGTKYDVIYPEFKYD